MEMSFVDKVWRWLGGGDMAEEEIVDLPIPADKKTNPRQTWFLFSRLRR